VADLWRIRAACYSTRVLFTWRRLREGQLGLLGREETPAAGLRSRPTREKGFPSNLLIN
jgi:hypothetical protein